MAEIIKTTAVNFITSFLFGQVTLESSSLTSLKKAKTFFTQKL